MIFRFSYQKTYPLNTCWRMQRNCTANIHPKWLKRTWRIWLPKSKFTWILVIRFKPLTNPPIPGSSSASRRNATANGGRPPTTRGSPSRATTRSSAGYSRTYRWRGGPCLWRLHFRSWSDSVPITTAHTWYPCRRRSDESSCSGGFRRLLRPSPAAHWPATELNWTGGKGFAWLCDRRERKKKF